MELALLYFSIKTSFAEVFKHLFDIPAVWEYIIQVHKYIILIDYNIDIQKTE